MSILPDIPDRLLYRWRPFTLEGKRPGAPIATRTVRIANGCRGFAEFSFCYVLTAPVKPDILVTHMQKHLYRFAIPYHKRQQIEEEKPGWGWLSRQGLRRLGIGWREAEPEPALWRIRKVEGDGENVVTFEGDVTFDFIDAEGGHAMA